MSVLLEISMWPLGKGESVGEYVASSVDVIDQSGLPYQVNAMGTVLEGELAELLAVVKNCFDRMARDCDRIECMLKFDYRSGAKDRLTAKIDSVERKLGRTLNK